VGVQRWSVLPGKQRTVGKMEDNIRNISIPFQYFSPAFLLEGEYDFS
jgi:hypothetical protein